MKGKTFLIINNKKILNGIKFVGESINSPEQRLIQGATALMTQPLIDLNNKDVDEDTRMMSVARTLAKIIAGTIVGVLVRQGSISLINAMSQYKFNPLATSGSKLQDVGKLRSLFLPAFKTVCSAMTEQAAKEEMNLYRKGMGTFIGTMVGLITNFLIDAPATKWLTGIFYKKIKKDDNQQENTSKTNLQHVNTANTAPSLLVKLQKEVLK
ncbi:MAG: hypothetical protein KHX03_01810 [Clostridium sp.]|nr:hypothetical protein [Clostridium sp.]